MSHKDPARLIPDVPPKTYPEDKNAPHTWLQEAATAMKEALEEPTLRDLIRGLKDHYSKPHPEPGVMCEYELEAEQAIIDYFVNLAPKILRTSNKINRTDSDGGFLVAPSEAYNMGTADYQQNIRLTKKGDV